MIELESTPTTRIEETESRGNLSVFEVNPLADGYGVTLGNALRRVLLSSVEGAAITHSASACTQCRRASRESR